MKNFYTDEKNVLIIISLLKQHKIKKVVASPGTMNVTFIGSIQNDPYFEIYSSVDERSAAYIACGLAAESGEPVVLTCTGATASRNYVPGLTEAFYRKIPILALTATPHMGKVGQNLPQIIDRTVEINDIIKLSVQIPQINSLDDEFAATNQINNALLELRRNGGGPVNINYVSTASKLFNVHELPKVRKIERYMYNDELPEIKYSKVAIFVGAHKRWDAKLINSIEKFCELYNGVVLCDQNSNYNGKYGISAALVSNQEQYDFECKKMDLLIDIGDISGAYLDLKPVRTWRVNPDGETRTRNYPLECVFEMSELTFFEKYISKSNNTEKNIKYFNEWYKNDLSLRNQKFDLPFSNLWVAGQIYDKMPNESIIYLGILNTLRCWNFYPLLNNSVVYTNTGGFGIDGTISSALGASLANNDKLCFCFCGDLGFFYDMNSLGNRFLGSNLRIMVINNGKGTEFRNYFHLASRFGDDADKYIAAAGHYGNQSKDLLKHYSQDLGFKYLSATNKEEFNESIIEFLNKDILDKPILFEIFTNSIDESNALKKVQNLKTNVNFAIKKGIKHIVGQDNVNKIKKITGRR